MKRLWVVSLLLILPCLLYPFDEAIRTEFLQAYYNGDYKKADKLLQNSFSDPVTKEVWENRIHLQSEINCKNYNAASSSARAIALLRIGEIERAKGEFTEDWLSLLGRATYAYWKNDLAGVRNQIKQALTLSPERPELLFFAGETASTDEEAIDYFTRFLAQPSEDPVKRSVAQYSIDFIKQTHDIRLNFISSLPGIDEIDTDFDSRGLLIQGTMNRNEKVTLMLDTGATGLVLKKRDWKPILETEQLVLGLGKKQITSGKRLVLERFQAGQLEIQNPVAGVSPSFPFSDIDGFTGSNLFSNHRILIPMKAGRKMVLLPFNEEPSAYFTRKDLNFSLRETFPFYIVNKMIILKGRIKKSPENMDILLDTGSDGSLISVATAKKYAYINYPLSLQLRHDAIVSGVGGTAENLLIAENVEVAIGGIKKNFDRMRALNLADTSESLDLELDLILGRDFLQGYTLLIDYRNRTVTFLK